MDLLESIFSEPKFKIPVEFGSDDFKTEVDTLLTIYIRELEGRGVSQAVLDSCLETPQKRGFRGIIEERRSAHGYMKGGQR